MSRSLWIVSIAVAISTAAIGQSRPHVFLYGHDFGIATETDLEQRDGRVYLFGIMVYPPLQFKTVSDLGRISPELRQQYAEQFQVLERLGGVIGAGGELGKSHEQICSEVIQAGSLEPLVESIEPFRGGVRLRWVYGGSVDLPIHQKHPHLIDVDPRTARLRNGETTYAGLLGSIRSSFAIFIGSGSTVVAALSDSVAIMEEVERARSGCWAGRLLTRDVARDLRHPRRLEDMEGVNRH